MRFAYRPLARRATAASLSADQALFQGPFVVLTGEKVKDVGGEVLFPPGPEPRGHYIHPHPHHLPLEGGHSALRGGRRTSHAYVCGSLSPAVAIYRRAPHDQAPALREAGNIGLQLFFKVTGLGLLGLMVLAGGGHGIAGEGGEGALRAPRGSAAKWS